MVYKVLGNFTNENLDDFIQKLSKKFKLIYKGDSLYLALNKYNNEVRRFTLASIKSDINNGNLVIDGKRYETKEEIEERLDKYLKEQVFLPKGDFWIKRIDDINDIGNIQDNTGFVKQWIEENLVRLDKERLEIEKEEELRKVWNEMDKVEKELEERMREIASRNKDDIDNMGNNK